MGLSSGGGVALAALAALAIFSAEDRFIASIFLAAVAGAFVLLRLVAAGLRHSPVEARA